VQCSIPLAGLAATQLCSVACDACGKCAADGAPGLITMQDNLPVIDFSSGGQPLPEAIFRCATRSIVWLEREQFQDQESRRAGTG
jgi:hypothetical protein